MQNDLVDVLKNPLRFAKMKAHSMLDHPRAIPGKTLSYAKYDVVRVMNLMMEALGLDQSSLERLVGQDHGGAGAPLHADAEGQLSRQPRRQRFRRPGRARHLPEPDSRPVAGRPSARNAASTSRSSSSPELANATTVVLV